MNKFEFYSNGDPWCDAWHCLNCGSYDTGQEEKENETVIHCYECKEEQKLSDMKDVVYTNKFK